MEATQARQIIADMRILVIANIPPFVTGGAETQARLLSEEFAALGHTVTVAGHEIPTNTEQNAFPFETAHIPTWRSNRFTRAASYFLSIALFLHHNKSKFDIIYCRFLGESALSICLTKRLLQISIPLIPCTACAGKEGDAARLRKLPFHRQLVSLVNKQCNAINNISPLIGEELASIGIHDSLFRFFPNGIRLPARKEKTSLSWPRKLVFLGRLAPQKGLHNLLEAAVILEKKGLSFELHLIGDGPDRQELEARTKILRLSSPVIFHGHIDNHDIIDHLRAYDIFVLPSLYEGFATAVIEAMFAGLPALVTISGGPDYFVDGNVGRLCPPADSNALASALEELLGLDDESLLALGRAGQQRVMERFDIRKIAQHYIDLFQELS